MTCQYRLESLLYEQDLYSGVLGNGTGSALLKLVFMGWNCRREALLCIYFQFAWGKVPLVAERLPRFIADGEGVQ